MIKIGNFLFHYRNSLFPLFYLALFIPAPNIFSGFYTHLILGLIIVLLGQTVRIITIGLVYIIRGGRNRQIYAEDLVNEGIFSHCRNPLYLGNILELLGLGIMSNSLLFIAIVFPLFLFFYQAIVLAEEDFLYKKFGEKFTEYLKNVNRWIPRLNGIIKTMKSMEFKWRRVLIKEYNATFMWTVAAVLLILKNYHSYFPNQNFNSNLPYFLLVILFLIICYAVIRYLKKSGKVVGN